MDQQRTYFTRIFDHLSKGLFLYPNSHQSSLFQQHRYLQQHADAFAQTILPLGFQLETGDAYFFLSRPHKPIVWEDRRTRIFRLLDIVDFCYSYNPAWETEQTVSLPDMVAACKQRPELARKLGEVRLAQEISSREAKLQQIFRFLVRGTFAECLDEEEGRYWISPAFAYLDHMFQALYLQI